MPLQHRLTNSIDSQIHTAKFMCLKFWYSEVDFRRAVPPVSAFCRMEALGIIQHLRSVGTLIDFLFIWTVSAG